MYSIVVGTSTEFLFGHAFKLLSTFSGEYAVTTIIFSLVILRFCVGVLMIKLTDVALKISIVRFECKILNLESVIYVLSQI